MINSFNGVSNAEALVPVPEKKWKRLYLGAGTDYSTVYYAGRDVINADGVDANDNRLYKNRHSASLRPLFVTGTDLNLKKAAKK